MPELIRSGGDSGAVTEPADTIDWSAVAELQLWSLRDETLVRAAAPAGIPGARYVLCAVFGDATWMWTDILDDPDEAVTAIRALSAVHGAAVRRSGRHVDDRLPPLGY